jgi:hypothetical protein
MPWKTVAIILALLLAAVLAVAAALITSGVAFALL